MGGGGAGPVPGPLPHLLARGRRRTGGLISFSPHLRRNAAVGGIPRSGVLRRIGDIFVPRPPFLLNSMENSGKQAVKRAIMRKPVKTAENSDFRCFLLFPQFRQGPMIIRMFYRKDKENNDFSCFPCFSAPPNPFVNFRIP